MLVVLVIVIVPEIDTHAYCLTGIARGGPEGPRPPRCWSLQALADMCPYNIPATRGTASLVNVTKYAF